MRRDFIEAITSREKDFGLELPASTIERLADYYELVQVHNPILHLVGPCKPEEFATRHILESLTLLEYLPTGVRFVDIGPGAGLPSIPCLIARDDLSAVLIESKEKKSRFLELAASNLFAAGRLEVINRQFEEVRDLESRFVTCRALDRFTGKLPRLLKWAKGSKLLLFGGNSLRDALDRLHLQYEAKQMPLSQQRYLFVSK